jgi:hypothetical protein
MDQPEARNNYVPPKLTPRSITDEQLVNLFTYHAPKPEQFDKYDVIRKSALQFARVLVENTPPSADQSAAIRLLRECVMTANAAIACES